MIGKLTKSTVERLARLTASCGTPHWLDLPARRQRRHVHSLLRYRINGPQRFHSIGRQGSPWTVDQARNEARRLLGLVATKVDPASEQVRPVETLGNEIERYLERKRGSLKPRSLTEIERHLLIQSKLLHHLRLTEVDRRTVALTLAEIEQRSGPIARNRARASLSAFFPFAIRGGLAEVNPVTGKGVADEGQSRERVLSKEELAHLLGALGNDPFSEIIRLLVLTGQRRNEIGGLRWEEIDFSRNLIVLP